MISAYLDEFKTMEDINKAASKLSLKRIPLRNINEKNIYFLKEKEIEEIKETLRKNKIKISMIDIDVAHDIYSPIDVVKIGNLAKAFGCRNVVIRMPKFFDFEAEKKQISIVYNDLITSFRKEKMDLNFHVDYEIESAYIAAILKEFKHLQFVYNPGECYSNDKSITTYYRLLRNNISNAIVFDIDKDKKPTLIGYGKALVLDIIDKLNNDKFKGDLYYDSNLGDYVRYKNEETQEGFFKRLFSRKKRKSHQMIDEKLRVDENEEVDFIPLLKSQLKLLSKYQKS